VPGVKTNEREGTRAVLRHSRMSASKVRQVLNLIRGQDADRAAEILALGDREAAATVGKVLASAVANAVHNDGLDAEDLYVSACYADEGSTLKRWRPRARGRATRIRKRTSHITIIVSRLPDERIARRRAKQAAGSSQRSRRVAGSRRRQQAEASASTAPVKGGKDTELESEPGGTAEADVGETEQVESEGTEPEAGTESAHADDEAVDTAEDAGAKSEETDGESAEEKGE
jgi:large subunit ribosomal protein L22